MFGPTVKPKQPVQAEWCRGAEFWRLLPSSDTELLCEVGAGPLSVSPLHPADRDNLFLLFQGEKQQKRGETVLGLLPAEEAELAGPDL